jgi:hypothetical protein
MSRVVWKLHPCELCHVKPWDADRFEWEPGCESVFISRISMPRACQLSISIRIRMGPRGREVRTHRTPGPLVP